MNAGRRLYKAHPDPTFPLLDAPNGLITRAPSVVARVNRLGPLTVYLFDYDIARHIRADSRNRATGLCPNRRT